MTVVNTLQGIPGQARNEDYRTMLPHAALDAASPNEDKKRTT